MASAKEIHKQRETETKTTRVHADEPRWDDHDLDKLATAVAALAGVLARVLDDAGDKETVTMLKTLAYDVSRYGIPF